MADAQPTDRADQLLAALLRGESIAGAGYDLAPDAFVAACCDRDLPGLIYLRLQDPSERGRWPAAIVEPLAQAARAEVGRELLRQRELVAVLTALAEAGVQPVLLKGTAFAYSLYQAPWLRPRVDTDLLIARDQVARVRQVMTGLGYHVPPHCDGELVFGQFPLRRTDRFGLTHLFDVHWRISTQAIFARVLTSEAVAARARPAARLCAHARVPDDVDALVLSCIHPVMHHRNERHLLWLYDVRLLATRLSTAQWAAFVDLAAAQQVAEVCAAQLRLARDILAAPVPDGVLERLRARAGAEPSAEYLRPGRRWLDDHLATLRALPRWRDRARLLREVFFPGPAYLLAQSPGGTAWPAVPRLPYLYLRRIVLGAWKVCSGRK